NARAYAVGHHIVFAEGHYAPHTPEGRRLLAHELAHVLQQRGAGPWLVQRAETDTASPPPTPLADSLADVNQRINEALDNARKAGTTADIVIAGLVKELADNGTIGRSKIEDWAATLPASKVYLPAPKDTKYAGVGFRLWSTGFPILNPTMNVKGILIGSDKLGHFLQQGHDYYQLARNNKVLKAGEADAERMGRSTEEGGFGLRTTGVYSNADLVANKSGMKFYQDLAAAPGMTFDLANYITPEWNEEKNPSYYESSVGKTVWANLLGGTPWKGEFKDAPGGCLINPAPFEVKLTVASGVSVTGTFEYGGGPAKVTGKVLNGVITHQNAATVSAVAGVKVEFDWEGGGFKGKGVWQSKGERTLEGTFGLNGASSGVGPWNMSK
ncbi:MAG: DUF4157 domain-containing protein, partial [Gemmataceae bacterium]